MYFFELWFYWDIWPGVGLLDRVVVLYLVFWGPSILLSIVVVPPTVREGSLFSTPSAAFVIGRLMNDGHSDRCDLHFSHN